MSEGVKETLAEHRNYFVGDQTKIDLQKVRSDAEFERNKGTSAVIHLHFHQQGCKGRQHEYFPIEGDEEEILLHD